MGGQTVLQKISFSGNNKLLQMKFRARSFLSILMLLVIIEALSAQSTPKYENGKWVDIDPKAGGGLEYSEFFDDEMVEKVKSALLCMQRHSWEHVYGSSLYGPDG